MTTETDARLYRIRSLAHLARNGHEVPIATLANEILTLDAQLSGGGQPPEAWREGPDAPPRGHKDRLIMAADLLNMDPNDLMTALDNTVRDEDEPNREPSPEQERAWDSREDDARGHALTPDA